MARKQKTESELRKNLLKEGGHGFICHPSDVHELSRRALITTGVSLTGYLSTASLMPPLFGQSEQFSALKRLVWINMRGGWDILEITDPKTGSTAGIDMTYDYGLATQLAGSNGERIGRWLPNLGALGNDMVVVRGIAMGTTSHNAGSIYMDTGVLSNAGTVNAASIPAIVASESDATIPIIQLNGGSDPMIDRGLLSPVSVVRAQNLELYRSLYPETQVEIDRKNLILDHVKKSIGRVQDKSGANDRLTAVTNAESKI